jgi:hypothetical protein
VFSARNIRSCPLLAIATLTAGCPSDEDLLLDCAQAAVPLLRRCDQRFSKAEPWRCLSTYVGEDAARLARADEMTVKLCEVTAPRGELGCYESSSCEEIAMGACTPEGSLRSSIEEDCRIACEQAVVGCQVPCNIMSTADVCEDCVIACETEKIRCFERCPPVATDS